MYAENLKDFIFDSAMKEPDFMPFVSEFTVLDAYKNLCENP